ncbi:MAG: GNAT family N-acetyltransferase [Blastocatellales bacterium]
MKLEIQKAKSEETAKLTEIALAAKRNWGYPESWIQLWLEELTITTDYLEANEVYTAIEAGKPVGFYALIETGSVTELDHLWVLPELTGKGIGSRLISHAIERAAAAGATAVEVVSDPNAEGFYLKAGANRIGEVVSIIEGRERRLPRLRIEIQR